MIPYYPTEDDEGKCKWDINTIEEKTIANYCNISLLEVENLNLVEYLCYLRDAFIYNLSQTKDGLEYLDNAWRIQQTSPERQKLRNKYGNKEANQLG